MSLDGGVVVKALLIAGLWLAGWGAARLVATVLPDAGVPGQFVAVTLAIWNPYVAERLLQGHWSLLVGYGCLPWVAATMLRLRYGAHGSPLWSRSARWPFWIALAGLTPTGLMLAATVALVVLAGARFRPGTRGCARRRGAVAAAVAALPWLTAAAVSRVVVAAQARAGSRRSPRAPNPASARWAAWPASAASGTARPYRASRTTLFALVAAVGAAGGGGGGPAGRWCARPPRFRC